ncbi:PhzF family phenazine biosynthesis protein [Candidatus Sumerlaeota bacterium]|nr:PhzF family phenazine biosynthesis protein [Candidatus Sumerlaeota bacterium]
MSDQRVHIVNAFTDSPEGGNPAGVCLPEHDLPTGEMQRIAAEVNLSETAFLRPEGEGWRIRWFTPTTEVPLCGHATLASAHTLWELGRVPPDQTIVFQSASGPLTATRDGGWIELDFPSDPPEPAEIPVGLTEALRERPLSVSRAKVGHLVEVESAEKVRCLAPDIRAIDRTVGSVCVTARSDTPEFDFISRFFAPEHGIDEDPVTGAAHCALAPHWAARLGKEEMMGFQASARGGTVRVRLRGDRVLLGGKALMR